MKAAVVSEPGARWEIKEVPTPQAGPGQVLIRVRACGVCHNDVWLTNGVYPFPPLNPVIVGHEAAGEIVELGAGVRSRQVGDRVGTTWVQGTCGRCDYCKRNLPVTGQSAMNCPAPVMTGMTAQGGHAEYIAVAAESTVLLPEAISFEQAAPVLCAGYTAWSALRAANPKPSERIAVLGIGGLGHMALQYAKATGHETIAITRTPDKHDLARELGADVVVSNGAELREAGGADVVLVTGTSYPAAEDALAGLNPNGRLVLATIDPMGAFTIDPSRQFFAMGQSIIGASHNGLDELAEALDLVATGKVTPVTEVFDSEDIADVIEKVDKHEVRFRAVVRY